MSWESAPAPPLTGHSNQSYCKRGKTRQAPKEAGGGEERGGWQSVKTPLSGHSEGGERFSSCAAAQGGESDWRDALEPVYSPVRTALGGEAEAEA